MSGVDCQDWLGSVVRSDIDSRVWVAVIPGVDTRGGAMGASTSLRQCKSHVEEHAARAGFDLVWQKTTSGEWDAVERADGSDDA